VRKLVKARVAQNEAKRDDVRYPPAHRAVWTDRIGQGHRRADAHVGDVGLAEDLAQDALVAAEPMPESGVPNNPGACSWPPEARAIDSLLAASCWTASTSSSGHELEARQESPEASCTRRSTITWDDLLSSCSRPVIRCSRQRREWR